MITQQRTRLGMFALLALIGAAVLLIFASTQKFAQALVASDALVASSTPVISGVSASTTATDAMVMWTTNIPATSQVIWGPSEGNYTATSSLETTLSTHHSVTLMSLTPNTMYHYKVMSLNGSSTATTSIDYSFMTMQASSTMGTSTMSTSTAMASSTVYHVMVMKHLCNANIKTLQDFTNLETGKASIAALANTVLNCPATALVGNDAVAGTVSSPRMMYSFQVMNGTTTKTLADGTFTPKKLCESDINLDVNNDGAISSTTCLDISHYNIPITAMASSSMITVTENMQPTGFHFGTVRFTPNALSANNDQAALVSTNATTGVISLDMKDDTDNMVMLHVYNFPNATTSTSTGAGGGTGTTTGSGMGSTTTGTTTPPDTQSLQDQINALKLRVQTLENQIAGLLTNNGGNQGGGSGNGGTSTPPVNPPPPPPITNGVGMIDQNGQSVKAGGGIDFGGHNFGKEEHVFIMLNGSKVGEGFTNSSGSFSSGSMSVPNMPNTTATYTFVGQMSGITAAATLTITP